MTGKNAASSLGTNIYIISEVRVTCQGGDAQINTQVCDIISIKGTYLSFKTGLVNMTVAIQAKNILGVAA